VSKLFTREKEDIKSQLYLFLEQKYL